jgi:hypothetical protein
MLAAIRVDRPRPPVHARNLYHLAAAMWDGWAAYDSRATQLFHHERGNAADNEAARAETISYAAYRLIRARYEQAIGAKGTLVRLDSRFVELGYDPAFTSTGGSRAAALGNRIFASIQVATNGDGANEAGDYQATNGYLPVNPPLEFANPGTSLVDPNRWQPLTFPAFVEQNGIPAGTTIQTFICPHWGDVTPFALTRARLQDVYLDPGPPPLLGSSSDARYKSEFSQLIAFSSLLDPDSDATIDISPGNAHNNTLGEDDGRGHASNPVTGQPYAPNVVRLADYARLLSEYWADGPNSETPPGHWNVIANLVSDNPQILKRLDGRPVNDLEWDCKLYLALNGALHDAAVVAWGHKLKYDSVRPISAVRYMGGLPGGHPDALPLEPALVERITAESSAPGGRHEHLAGHQGEVAVRSWRGQPADPQTEDSGVGWILASTWMPYQKFNFVTPAFAGYTSGHSTFSRAAAEVMAAFTGSAYFPGGLQRTLVAANGALTVERGPSADMELQWATYFDASDEAGLSRRYGGIHIEADDHAGRLAGARAGKGAFARAQKLFQGVSG